MSKQLEQLLNQIQVQNQQLQTIMLQRQNMEIQKKEIENALEELETAKKEEIYKSVGPILIKTSKAKIEKELKELKEDLDIRVKSLEKQEKILKEKIKENQKKFQGLLPESGQGG